MQRVNDGLQAVARLATHTYKTLNFRAASWGGGAAANAAVPCDREGFRQEKLPGSAHKCGTLHGET